MLAADREQSQSGRTVLLKRYRESQLFYLFKELSFVTFHCVCARNEMWILCRSGRIVSAEPFLQTHEL